MITLPHIHDSRNNNNTTNMITTTNRIKKRLKKADKQKIRTRDKANSPGVPPNTCPYIDLVITMINDMHDAYERLRTSGEHQPKMDDIKTLAEDQLEYIRRANECLRDNSAYWYNKYKSLL